jgi:hypothetical protein
VRNDVVRGCRQALPGKGLQSIHRTGAQGASGWHEALDRRNSDPIALMNRVAALETAKIVRVI